MWLMVRLYACVFGAEKRNSEVCYGLLLWLAMACSERCHIYAFSFRKVPRVHKPLDCQDAFQLLSSYTRFVIPEKGIAHINRL